MFLWIVRQLLSIRRILLGRHHPHQMAWALALGLAIGLIPKGNLVAVLMITTCLLLQVNHALATVTAIVVSFAAMRLDPWSHQIGLYVLEHPEWRGTWEALWRQPLMAWTSLNNTVVLGSLLVGLGLMLPTYGLTFPIFRSLARRSRSPQAPPEPPPAASAALALSAASPGVTKPLPITPPVTMQPVAKRPRNLQRPTEPSHAKASGVATVSDEPIDFREVPKTAAPMAVETQIDVIRIRQQGASPADAAGSADATGSREVTGAKQALRTADSPGSPANPSQGGGPDPKMNEALGYLLRRLRDERQEKAA